MAISQTRYHFREAPIRTRHQRGRLGGATIEKLGGADGQGPVSFFLPA